MSPGVPFHAFAIDDTSLRNVPYDALPRTNHRSVSNDRDSVEISPAYADCRIHEREKRSIWAWRNRFLQSSPERSRPFDPRLIDLSPSQSPNPFLLRHRLQLPFRPDNSFAKSRPLHGQVSTDATHSDDLRRIPQSKFWTRQSYRVEFDLALCSADLGRSTLRA